MNKRLEFSNLVELIRWRAQDTPDKVAYTFLVDGEREELTLTYKELDLSACAIAAHLQKQGMSGERALLLYPSGLEFIAAFFGCLYAGVVAVPAYTPRFRPKRPDVRFQAMTTDSQATVVLTTSKILSDNTRWQANVPSVKHWLASDQINGELASLWLKPALRRETLAYLQYTSGSTGTPKGVMVTHGNLLHNSEMIYNSFGHSPLSQAVIWLPLYHDMGLIGGVIQTLYGGFPVTLMSPVAFIQKPLRWLQAISYYKATTSGGPNFAYDLCVQQITPDERATLDLSSWDVAFNGAEPIRAETLARFAMTFEAHGFRQEAFYPCYGMAEATLLISGALKAVAPIIYTVQRTALQQNQVVHASDARNSVGLVSAGQNLLYQNIVVVDPDSATRCQPGQIGEIWVSSASVTKGYWKRPEETEHTFHAYLTDREAPYEDESAYKGPFLRTGDLGFMKDNELFITGRLKDLIIIRGRNHYPQDIERTVEQSHPVLRPGYSAAFSVEHESEERLVVCVEVKRTARRTVAASVDEVVALIRQAVLEEHDVAPYAIVLLRTMSIPKTSSGKIQRHLCRTKFLEDRLKVVGAWKSAQSHMPSEMQSSDSPSSEQKDQSDVTPVLREAKYSGSSGICSQICDSEGHFLNLSFGGTRNLSFLQARDVSTLGMTKIVIKSSNILFLHI